MHWIRIKMKDITGYIFQNNLQHFNKQNRINSLSLLPLVDAKGLATSTVEFFFGSSYL